MKMEGQDAARAFVAKHFPDCLAAVLFGSVARGEATATSDLDIIMTSLKAFKMRPGRSWSWGRAS